MEGSSREVKQDKKEGNHDFEAVVFIGNQHLTDIREIKNHQRNITFQYILIAIAIAGLSKIKEINVCAFWIKAIITVVGVAVIYFLCQFQKSLRDYRRRIYNIWKEPYFKTAIEKDFLNVDKKYPEEYLSLCYQLQYPIIYIILILMVIISM